MVNKINFAFWLVVLVCYIFCSKIFLPFCKTGNYSTKLLLSKMQQHPTINIGTTLSLTPPFVSVERPYV